jgi:hypothetical protein
MMLKGNLLAGTSTLATFLGIGKGTEAAPAKPAVRAEPVLTAPPPAAAQAAADDDDALDDCGDDDEDKPDDEDDEETAKAKKARRVERKKAREKAEKEKAEKEAEDDDSDTEMRGNGPMAKARLRERARCAAIFACDAAADNVALAAHLAFNTKATRQEAIGMLRAAPKGDAGASPLDRAMAAHAGRGPGADVPKNQSDAAAADAGWDNAFKAAAARK